VTCWADEIMVGHGSAVHWWVMGQHTLTNDPRDPSKKRPV